MTIEDLTAENKVLVGVKDDLLKKKVAYKEKIASLEADTIRLKTELDAALANVKTAAVERPKKRLLKQISGVPDVLAEQLAKSYTFESNDEGDLLLMNLDGTPAMKDKHGNALPIDANSLCEFLSPRGSEEASAKVYAHLLLARSRASGGGAVGSGKGANTVAEPETKTERATNVTFGLR